MNSIKDANIVLYINRKHSASVLPHCLDFPVSVSLVPLESLERSPIFGLGLSFFQVHNVSTRVCR